MKTSPGDQTVEGPCHLKDGILWSRLKLRMRNVSLALRGKFESQYRSIAKRGPAKENN